MAISPELFQIPGIAVKFTKAGLTSEIVLDLMRGREDRNMISDAKKILPQFEKETPVILEGIENLKENGLIAFNHPDNNVLIPAFLTLALKLDELKGKQINLVMASEIEVSSKYNLKTALPGSALFIERFHKLYGGNIISTPTVQKRSDYLSGRAIALRQVINRLKAGQIIAIAPEGHTETNEEISPSETFHEGSGSIARLASSFKLPTVPVGLWKDEKGINIKIGSPIYNFPQDNKDAVIKLMSVISQNLPLNLRGPFKI